MLNNDNQTIIFIFAFTPYEANANVRESLKKELKEYSFKEVYISYGPPINNESANLFLCLNLSLVKEEQTFSFVAAKPEEHSKCIADVLYNSRKNLIQIGDGGLLEFAYEEDYLDVISFCQRSLDQFNLNREESQKLISNLKNQETSLILKNK